jgi:hypothetical protein
MGPLPLLDLASRSSGNVRFHFRLRDANPPELIIAPCPLLGAYGAHGARPRKSRKPPIARRLPTTMHRSAIASVLWSRLLISGALSIPQPVSSKQILSDTAG